MSDRKPSTTEREREVIEAAIAFVKTTSYYRQPKDSRPEFERLAHAAYRWQVGQA